MAKDKKEPATVRVNLTRNYRDNASGKTYGPGRDIEVPADSTVATFGVPAEQMHPVEDAPASTPAPATPSGKKASE